MNKVNKEVFLLKWIYNRLLNEYLEKPNYSHMRLLKELIESKEKNERVAKVTPAMYLDKWEVIDIGDVFCLRGYIYNDIKGRFKDGESIVTSAVESIYLEAGEYRAKTKNSVYILGKELHEASSE